MQGPSLGLVVRMPVLPRKCQLNASTSSGRNHSYGRQQRRGSSRGNLNSDQQVHVAVCPAPHLKGTRCTRLSSTEYHTEEADGHKYTHMHTR